VSASTIAGVATGDERSWQEVAAGNRERIRALEHEQDRMRDSIHKLSAETAAILYLTKEVGKLENAVEDLADKLERIARRALEKPTATGLSIAAQYLSFFVALIALGIAATR
jgi:predicted  nucleic acid-binding Zn-ribbon protein